MSSSLQEVQEIRKEVDSILEALEAVLLLAEQHSQVDLDAEVQEIRKELDSIRAALRQVQQERAFKAVQSEAEKREAARKAAQRENIARLARLQKEKEEQQAAQRRAAQLEAQERERRRVAEQEAAAKLEAEREAEREAACRREAEQASKEAESYQSRRLAAVFGLRGGMFLPTDVWRLILHDISALDAQRARRVCRFFCEAIDTQSLWRRYVARDFPGVEAALKRQQAGSASTATFEPTLIDWHAEYRRRYAATRGLRVEIQLSDRQPMQFSVVLQNRSDFPLQASNYLTIFAHGAGGLGLDRYGVSHRLEILPFKLKPGQGHPELHPIILAPHGSFSVEFQCRFGDHREGWGLLMRSPSMPTHVNFLQLPPLQLKPGGSRTRVEDSAWKQQLHVQYDPPFARRPHKHYDPPFAMRAAAQPPVGNSEASSSDGDTYFAHSVQSNSVILRPTRFAYI